MTRPLQEAPASPLLVPVRESRAAAALVDGPAGTSALDLAETESRAALRLAPATSTAWLRLAYVQRMRTGAIDPVVLEHLEGAYDAAPLGPDVTEWRLRFMFENWPLMTPGLRRLAVRELTATARYRGARARAFTQDIQNPEGRLAAQMATHIARSYDPAPTTTIGG